MVRVADGYLMKENLPEVERILSEIEEEMKQLPDLTLTDLEGKCALIRGKLYAAKKDSDLAIQHFKNGLRVTEKSTNVDLKCN